MSLKAFHLFFITLATLLAFGCAGAAFMLFRTEGGALHLLWMILGALAGVGLVVYEFWFLRKTRKLIL